MIWAALSLGLLGGLHCLGMCGPIALALPRGDQKTRYLVSKTLYNAGRILTYVILGAIVGAAGQMIAVAGWQQGLSIASGVLLILMALFSFSRQLDMSFLAPFVGLSRMVRKGLGPFIKQNTYLSHVVFGTINGLLPCGLVYMAVAGALSTGSAGEGAVFMAAFGLGTFPWMFAVSLGQGWILSARRPRITRLIPVFVLLLGCLFILRGLNLGIPYVSPDLGSPHTDHMSHQ